MAVHDGQASFNITPVTIWDGLLADPEDWSGDSLNGLPFINPTDRSNISGPYWITSYDFPFTSAYPSIFAGRDEGAMIWGETGGEGGHFKYAVGAFLIFENLRSG